MRSGSAPQIASPPQTTPPATATSSPNSAANKLKLTQVRPSRTKSRSQISSSRNNLLDLTPSARPTASTLICSGRQWGSRHSCSLSASEPQGVPVLARDSAACSASAPAWPRSSVSVGLCLLRNMQQENPTYGPFLPSPMHTLLNPYWLTFALAAIA